MSLPGSRPAAVSEPETPLLSNTFDSSPRVAGQVGAVLMGAVDRGIHRNLPIDQQGGIRTVSNAASTRSQVPSRL